MCSGWLKQTELLELLSNERNKDKTKDFLLFNTAELLELLSNAENKDHSRIFHEFDVVQPC